MKKSGQYPYREGMTVRDLVLLAGGLDQSAYLNEAEVARLPENRAGGVTARTFRVPLDSSYLFEQRTKRKVSRTTRAARSIGAKSWVTVLPYDNVLILRQAQLGAPENCGGRGRGALPRQILAENQVREDHRSHSASGRSHPGRVRERRDFYRHTNGVGRIGIELPDVLRNPRSLDNLPLQDGDSLFIPRYNAVVAVQGAVNSPVSVTWSPGKTIEYYIRAAGGPSRKADIGRAYVTQPNGKVEARATRFLLPDGVPKPQAGSTVYVPERDPADRPLDFLSSAGAIAQIAATLVTLVIALRR